jgi:hypothetical protein
MFLELAIILAGSKNCPIIIKKPYTFQQIQKAYKIVLL